MEQRIYKLDILRTIALFCIVLCHTKIGHEDSQIIEKFNWFLGKCGVPIFIMISGYLGFPIKNGIGLKNYLLKKTKRVLIPLAIWMLIYILISYERGYSINGLLMNTATAHLWFIYAIFGLFLITPIISPYLSSASHSDLKFYLILWGITTCFPFITEYLGWKIDDHNYLYIFYYMCGYVGWYVLGYYFKKHSSTKLLQIKLNIMFLFLFVIFIYCGYYVFDFTTVQMSNYNGLIIVLYSVAMYGIISKLHIRNIRVQRIFTNISIYSFGIFLVHMIFAIYLYPYLPTIKNVPVLFFNIIYTILNIFCSYFIVYYLSKVKYLRAIFG